MIFGSWRVVGSTKTLLEGVDPRHHSQEGDGIVEFDRQRIDRQRTIRSDIDLARVGAVLGIRHHRHGFDRSGACHEIMKKLIFGTMWSEEAKVFVATALKRGLASTQHVV